MSKANLVQIGGDHYKNGGEEHWDRVHRLGLDYFQAAITKYVERWKLKNGVQDLQKARHFLDKYIELHTPAEPSTPVDLTNAQTAADSLQESGVRVVHIGHRIQQAPIYAFTPGQILPTGWVQFVFEGIDARGAFFTCKECKNKFYAVVGSNPHNYHECRGLVDNVEEALRAADATRAYVDQG